MVGALRQAHKKRRRLLGILVIPALLVGIGVSWQLRLTGLSLSGQAYCGYTEHTHTDTCLVQTLICNTLEEETLSSFADTEGNAPLLCQDTQHTHNQACYDESLQPETPAPENPHRHTEDCYQTDYTCGFAPDYQHTHSLQCYSDPQADLETPEQWESSVQGVELSGDWAGDLIAVACTQLGYRESSLNYFVDSQTGLSRGITRYGQWYGDGYARWNTLFAAWCMHYAGLPAEHIPFDLSPAQWLKDLTSQGLCGTERDKMPQMGDIAFFDTNQDGLADRVGLVTEATGQTLCTIEGELAQMVGQMTYPADGNGLVGYLDMALAYRLYTAPPTEEVAAQTYQASLFTDQTYSQPATDEVTILVTGSLPDGAQVYAYPVQVTMEDQTVLCAYDITVLLQDGSVYEPSEKLTVQFISPQLAEGQDTAQSAVYYIPGEGAPEQVQATPTEDGIRFDAGHFSIYAWVETGVTSVSNATALRNAVTGATGTRRIALAGNIDITIASNSMAINTGADIMLNLNGYRLTFSGNAPLFTLRGGTLTVIDTAWEADPGELREAVGGADARAAGRAATTSINQNAVTLTYYVTDSRVFDTERGITRETCEKRTVTSKGLLRNNSTSNPLFSVATGTLKIGGGFIYGNNAAGRAIVQSGGSVELSGGYICGFAQSGGNDNAAYGGAIRATGGSLRILQAAVLAGNRAPCGGAIAVYNTNSNNRADLLIDGGVISGNTATLTNESGNNVGGGGIYVRNTDVTMQAGYLTNNIALCTGYFNGGGGILLYSSDMRMTGGYVTGNRAASGGGIRTPFQNVCRVFLEGGFISANYALSAEGGGVCIDNQGYCEVGVKELYTLHLYISNNATDSTHHWGGGGLFGANGANLFVHNLVVTENSAGGYGGGVAGCSTGRVVVAIQNGAAIFNNSALGQQLSGDESSKSQDHLYAKMSEVFLRNQGYQDFYCALASTVYGGMLGDMAANWSGSMDGMPVTDVGREQVLNASYIMGLTAAPSETAIAAAERLATVHITGNYSYTHGGGILSNGHLIIGNVTDFDIGDSLEFEADKALLDGSGRRLPVLQGDFTFEVLDDMGTVLSLGTTQDDGSILFDRRLSFDGEGDYHFTIRERDCTNPAIIKDTATYSLIVTVTVDRIELVMASNDKVYYRFHRISHLRLSKQTSAGEVVIFNEDVQSAEDSAYLYNMPSPTFTNYSVQTIDITVQKEWQDTQGEPVAVTLYRNGESYDTQTLTAPDWRYTWHDLPTSSATDDYSYTVRETVPAGYVAGYSYTNTAEATGYWVPATTLTAGEQYIIVSADGTRALNITPEHQNAAFTNADRVSVTRKSGQLTMDGKVYTNWYEDTLPQRAVFTAQTYDDYVILKCNGASVGTWLLVQSSGSNFFKSTSAAQYASPFRLTGGKLQGRQEWSADGQLRYVVYQDNKFNTVQAGTAPAAAVGLYTRISTPITQTTTITITNRPVEQERFTLDITKQDAQSPMDKLAGAVFHLLSAEGEVLGFTGADGDYRAVEEQTPPETPVVTELVTVLRGRLVLSGLPAGSYILREVAAPDGYYLANDIPITLGTGETNRVELVVQDEKMEEYVLPETGGVGTLPYLWAGIALLAGAAVLLYKKHSTKKEQA